MLTLLLCLQQMVGINTPKWGTALAAKCCIQGKTGQPHSKCADMRVWGCKGLYYFLKRQSCFTDWYKSITKKRPTGIKLLLFGILLSLFSLVFGSSSGLGPNAFAFKGCCLVWPQCSVLLNVAFVDKTYMLHVRPFNSTRFRAKAPDKMLPMIVMLVCECGCMCELIIIVCI